MRRVLTAALSGTFMLQPVMVPQVTGYATPLTRIVLISTGAWPLSVTRLFAVVSGPLAVKLGVFSAASCERMLERALTIQAFTETGEVTLLTLAWNDAYLASRIGLMRVLSIGPVAISRNARQYARWNGGLLKIRCIGRSAPWTENRFWPGPQEPLLPSTMFMSQMNSVHPPLSGL